MMLKKTGDTNDQYIWRCRRVHTICTPNRNYKCKDVKLSVRYNSWLVDSKLSFDNIIELLYCWSNGYPSEQIMKEVGLCRRTLVEWTHFFRECCLIMLIENSQQIGGPGVEVEIDESKFGKRKYHKGKRVEGQWVFGGREKNNKSKVFMIPVKKRDEKTLMPIIKKFIKPGSIIHSDCWKAYTKLEKNGYTHLTVNHSKEFKNAETGACTNKIESDWRHAKVYLPRYGVHRGLHAGYLAEYMWHRKYKDNDKFTAIIKYINTAFSNKYLLQCPI